MWDLLTYNEYFLTLNSLNQWIHTISRKIKSIHLDTSLKSCENINNLVTYQFYMLLFFLLFFNHFINPSPSLLFFCILIFFILFPFILFPFPYHYQRAWADSNSMEKDLGFWKREKNEEIPTIHNETWCIFWNIRDLVLILIWQITQFTILNHLIQLKQGNYTVFAGLAKKEDENISIHITTMCKYHFFSKVCRNKC